MAWFLSLEASQSQNPGANQSTVSATLYLNWNNGSAYANYDQEFYIVVGGVSTGWLSAPRSVNWPNQTNSGRVGLWTHSPTFTHDINGVRGPVGTYGYFDGDGGFGPGDIDVNGPTFAAIDYVRLPSAPSSVSAVATGTTVVVTAGEASTPGPAISNYWVSFASSSNGGATFSSWSSESTMTSRAFTYTLTPGLTYKFRVRAENGDGYGGFTESATLFLTAGGKRWTGSDWALTVAQAKRFDGTVWDDIEIAKRYTEAGTWVNLS
jgi:hypothetical protein